MVKKILKLGNETLRKHCSTVTKFDLRLKLLLRDMADTMYDADGVGLAAPQIGILRRVIVIDTQEENGPGLIELINPVMIEQSGEQGGPEGCLSVPDRRGYVVRPEYVKVRAQNVRGDAFELEGHGLLARALCHEMDHLDGIIYVDKMDHEIFDFDRDDDKDGGAK